jgi:hypothetical protein
MKAPWYMTLELDRERCRLYVRPTWLGRIYFRLLGWFS